MRENEGNSNSQQQSWLSERVNNLQLTVSGLTAETAENARWISRSSEIQDRLRRDLDQMAAIQREHGEYISEQRGSMRTLAALAAAVGGVIAILGQVAVKLLFH